MPRGCGSKTAGPTPHNGERAGAVGPLPLGPGDFGAAPKRRTSLGSRAPALWVGEGRVADSGGRGARTRAGARAVGPVYTRGRASAVRPSRCAWPPTCAFPARISRFLELRFVGKSGFLGHAPARDPRLRGARLAVGWLRRREGAQVYTPAAGRGGGREVGSVRKVAGWALPALVTSRTVWEKPTGFAVCLAAPLPCKLARFLVFLEECGDPKPMCGVGA